MDINKIFTINFKTKIMRKLKLLTLALVIGATSLFASEKTENINTEIRDQVVNLFDRAKFETKEGFKVEFTFTFNTNGEIVVLNLDSNREDIKDYIRKNVNYKKIQKPGIKDRIYKMPINVKVVS